GALTGSWITHPWQGEAKAVDFYVVKGIIEGLFHHINRRISFEQSTLEGMHPGRCATLKVDGVTVGFMGQVHPAYAKEHDLKDTYVFDINMEYLLDTTKMVHFYETIPKHPSVLRDIAFVVDKEVVAGSIQSEIE